MSESLSGSFTEASLSFFDKGKNSDFDITNNESFGGNSFKNDSFNVILGEYKEVILNSLITAFGIDRLIFKDIDGGNVQTIHNAKEGVYANKTFEERGERKYNRDDYATSSYMNKRRKQDFKNNDKIYDCYTGRELPKDGRAHLEHIVSAKENHDNIDMRILFSKEEMSEVINQKDNTTYIDGSMNQSKSDTPLKEWEDRVSKKDKSKTNGEFYGVDSKKAHAADENARSVIDEQVARRKFKHYSKGMAKDSLMQGGQMAIRQGLGVVLAEVTMTILDEVPDTIRRLRGEFSVEKFFSNMGSLVAVAFERVKSKLGHILEAIKSGFVAGAFNSIITTIINMFITTAKNIVRLIRQAMVSITEAVRILFFDKEERTTGERVIAAAKVIVTGASTVLGVIVEQGLRTSLEGSGLVAIPVIGSVIGEVIPIFAGTLLTGLLSVTFLYFMDNSEIIKKLIDFINKVSDDCFDRALGTISQANYLLDKYIADLCSIDIDGLRSQVADIHEVNLGLAIGDNQCLYRYCENHNIKLQFSNTEEFVDLMLSDEALEI